MPRSGTDPFDDDTPDPFTFDDVTVLTFVLTVTLCLVVLLGMGLHSAERDLICLFKSQLA